MIIWIIAFLLLSGIVFYFVKSQKTQKEYITETVRRQDLIQTVSVTGKINSKEEYNLSFQANGKIVQLDVEVGDRIKKGEKIGSVEAGTLYSQLAGAQAEVEAQKKTLASMKKNKDVYDKNKRKAQEEIIKKAQASVDAIYDQLRGTIITSPIDGIVIKKNYRTGEVVMAGNTVVIVASEEALICEINVPESDIVKIKTGQSAALTLDAFSMEEKLEAKVFEIEPAATVIQDVVYYKAKLEIISPDSRLKIGMSVDADIKTAEVKNVIVAPLRAVKTENDREYVEVLKEVNGEKKAEKVFVKTGLRGDEGLVEITSGLNGGERVITLEKTL